MRGWSKPANSTGFFRVFFSCQQEVRSLLAGGIEEKNRLQFENIGISNEKMSECTTRVGVEQNALLSPKEK